MDISSHIAHNFLAIKGAYGDFEVNLTHAKKA